MSRSNGNNGQGGRPPQPPPQRPSVPQWQGAADPYAQFHADAAAWQQQQQPGQPFYATQPPPLPQPHDAGPALPPPSEAPYHPPPFSHPAQHAHPHAHGRAQPATAQPQWPQPSREPRPFDLADYTTGAQAAPADPYGRLPPGAEARPPVAPAWDQRFAPPAHDPRLYADPAPAPRTQPPHAHPGHVQAYAPAPHDDQLADDGYEEEFLDEEPKPRGRKLMVVGALVGAICVGGGLAYAYKTFSGAGGKTPLLKADVTPTKSKAPAANGPKIGEKLPDAAGSTAVASASDTDVGRPRPVPTQTITVGAPQPPPAPVSGVPGLVLDSSTMPARPLPPVVPVGPPAAQGPARVATPPAAPVAVAPPQAPRVVAVAPPPAAPAVAPPPPAQPVPKVAKAPAPKTPDAFTPSVAGGVAPAAIATAPSQTPKASLGASSAGGNGFVAVLASEKTRMDAMKRFADLQQRFPEQLGAKMAEVQEVNLGEAKGGVWFRAVVGPPGSREAAANVCKELRTAGHTNCWATAY